MQEVLWIRAMAPKNGTVVVDLSSILLVALLLGIGHFIF